MGFDELSELYTSTMLRSMGLSLIGIFVPIYLYKLDYSLGDIFLFLGLLFIGRVVSDIPAGYMIAFKGPKHTMLYSYLLQIAALLLLLTLPVYQWPLWLIAVVWGVSNSLYWLAYHVDFSKVMHSDHGGKELGFMTIVERMGGIFGPLVGGVIATVFGAQYTIAAAVVLFVLAVAPLFATPEPTRTRQRLWLSHMPLGQLKRDFVAYAALCAENSLTVSLWPLYIAVVIFTTNTYASVGAVTSIGVVAAILSAQVIGKIVDRHQGGVLLRWSALGMSLLHLIRPFVKGGGGVVLVNIVNEAVTTGYRIPFVKGFYDRADSLPGHRITYIVYAELIGDIGKALPWLILWGLTFVLGDLLAMQIGFVLAALASTLITTQKFPALQR